MKKLKKILISVALIAVAFCFQACGVNFELYADIENYDDIVSTVSEYVPQENIEPPKVAAEGYTLLNNNGFDAPACFYENSFAVTSLNGKHLLMDKDGNTFDFADDIGELVYDKYVYSLNGLLGLKDLSGNSLLSPRYDSITVVENNVMAADSKNIYIYKDNILVAAVEKNKCDVALIENDFTIVDGELCDLNLQPIMFGKFRAVNVYDGIAKIKNESERFGFYDISNDCVLIEPQYFTATQFVNGYAQVQKVFEGEYIIIDKAGREIKSFNRRTFGMYDGYMFAESEDGAFSLYDSEFIDSNLSFRGVFGGRVYGKFVIDTFYRRVFSLSENKYISEAFTEITPIENGFIFKTENGAHLYDKDFRKIGEYDDLYFDGGVLSVFYDGKYYCFSKTSEKNSV